MNLTIKIRRKKNIPDAESICVFSLKLGEAPTPSDS
jgi:hypothetical protein